MANKYHEPPSKTRAEVFTLVAQQRLAFVATSGSFVRV